MVSSAAPEFALARQMSPLFPPFSRLSAAAARICRCGALMFALLLAIPLMPLADRRWMMFALLGVFAILVYQILRDAVVLWRTGVWFESAGPGGRRGEIVRHARSARGTTADRDRVHVGGSAAATPSLHRTAPPGPASRPRRDVLVWADEPEPAPEPVRAARATAAPVESAASSGTGVTIEVRAFDDGVVALDLCAADGASAASTTITEPLESALRFGDGLRCFTGQPADRRDAQLGSFDPAERGGGLRVVLFSREGTSRAFITVWPDRADGSGCRQTTSIAFDVDPVQLRAFATALSAALLSPGSRVVLPAARS